MRLRHDVLRFPEGKSKAFTLSYDDGVIQDKRLIALFDQYGVKGTFNLNSGAFGQTDQYSHLKVQHSKILKNEVAEIYQNHEIACHTVTHPDLAALPSSAILYEVITDRKNLEDLSGRIVRGMAYPFGTFSNTTKEALQASDILYSRTVKSTHNFNLPTDLLEWNPTCHHDDPELLSLAEQFTAQDPASRPRTKLFYVWGHAYEFDNNQNWNVMEDLLKIVSGHDDVWYAPNIQIAEYMEAASRLRYSADGMTIFNPTCQDIWMNILDKDYCFKSGETVKIIRDRL